MQNAEGDVAGFEFVVQMILHESAEKLVHFVFLFFVELVVSNVVQFGVLPLGQQMDTSRSDAVCMVRFVVLAFFSEHPAFSYAKKLIVVNGGRPFAYRAMSKAGTEAQGVEDVKIKSK
jgi:hypothetical protein